MRYTRKLSKSIAIALVLISFVGIGGRTWNADSCTFAETEYLAIDDSTSQSSENDRIVLGYYRAWDRTTLNSIPWKSLTHVSHAFVNISDDGSLLWEARIPSERLGHIAHQHNVKVLLAIGGASSGDRLFQIAKSAMKRRTFLASAIRTVKEFGYDGIDLDWEFPSRETSGVFHTLLAELRAALTANQDAERPLLLTAAIPASDWHGKWINAKVLAEHCDLIQIMSYDFTGAWSNNALHHSAASAPDRDLEAGGYSVEHSLNYWIKQRGLPARKCLVGLPLYGRLFKAEKVGGAVKKEPQSANKPLTMQNREIRKLLDAGWMRVTASDPWLQSPDKHMLIAFDDPTSVKAKCLLADKFGCRGAFFWALGDEKPGKESLLQVAFETLRGPQVLQATPQ
ncbi:MAG: glycoside hydrolase family 18 protein [Planctomycetota bacterium]|nr:glycoside hydrolase family 18 protein [Planctomycetota bacterium]